MGLSRPHLVVLALVMILLFGRGRISEMMGDFGKGLKSFREGVADEGSPSASTISAAQLTDQSPVSGANAVHLAVTAHPVQPR